MKNKSSLLGERIGHLLVIGYGTMAVSASGKSKARKYLCKCDCGIEKEFYASSLYARKVNSCGCSQYEGRQSRNFSNLRVGCDRDHPNYNTWSMMIQRCYEENHDSYHQYGGRGISVQEDWLLPFARGFDIFNIDMGIKPVAECKLDRIDNALGYSKENCRWVTDTTSVLNRGLSKNNTSGVKGVVFYKDKWVAQLGLGYKNIYLGRFNDWFDAICARKSAENKYHKELMNDRL